MAFAIFDASIHSADIRNQSLKLSEITPNFGRFLSSQISWVQAPKSCIQMSCLPRGTSCGRVSWG